MFLACLPPPWNRPLAHQQPPKLKNRKKKLKNSKPKTLPLPSVAVKQVSVLFTGNHLEAFFRRRFSRSCFRPVSPSNIYFSTTDKEECEMTPSRPPSDQLCRTKQATTPTFLRADSLVTQRSRRSDGSNNILIGGGLFKYHTVRPTDSVYKSQNEECPDATKLERALDFTAQFYKHTRFGVRGRSVCC